tara:strand:- start:3087 stop:3500 length:414 start_codon:yes stop_codon:yes gene_type:complete
LFLIYELCYHINIRFANVLLFGVIWGKSLSFALRPESDVPLSFYLKISYDKKEANRITHVWRSMQMRSSERSMAVAQIVSAILAKSGVPPTNSAGRPAGDAEGFKMSLEDGKVHLLDPKGNKMLLEELFQYVDRYLP